MSLRSSDHQPMTPLQVFLGGTVVSNFASCPFNTFPSVVDHGDGSCIPPSLRDAN